jgi:hypothetical protein
MMQEERYFSKSWGSGGSDYWDYKLWGCDTMYEVWSETSGQATRLHYFSTALGSEFICCVAVEWLCKVICCLCQRSGMNHCAVWLCVVPSTISAALGIDRLQRTVFVHYCLLQIRQNCYGNDWGVKTCFGGEKVSRTVESDGLSKFRSGVTCIRMILMCCVLVCFL